VQADIARKCLNKVEVEEAEEDERALGEINVEDSVFLLWLSNPPVSPAAMQLHPHWDLSAGEPALSFHVGNPWLLHPR